MILLLCHKLDSVWCGCVSPLRHTWRSLCLQGFPQHSLWEVADNSARKSLKSLDLSRFLPPSTYPPPPPPHILLSSLHRSPYLPIISSSFQAILRSHQCYSSHIPCLLFPQHYIRTLDTNHMVSVAIDIPKLLRLFIFNSWFCSFLVPLVASRKSKFLCRATMYCSGHSGILFALGKFTTFWHYVTGVISSSFLLILHKVNKPTSIFTLKLASKLTYIHTLSSMIPQISTSSYYLELDSPT